MVNNLGNYFPGKLKQQIVEDIIKPGTVLKIYAQDTTPLKEKRAVIIGIADDQIAIATIYFNSNINPNKFNTEKLRNEHLFFEAQDRAYLTKDCYLNCGELHILNKKKLQKMLAQNTDHYLGCLSNEDFALVRNKVKNSRTLSPMLKKKYNVFY